MTWLTLWGIVHLFSNKPSENNVNEFLIVCFLLKESFRKKKPGLNITRCLLFVIETDHSLLAYLQDILQHP